MIDHAGNASNALPLGDFSLCADADGDGFSTCGVDGSFATTADNDCNDADSEIFPTTVWYLDEDGDGWSEGSTQVSCADPGVDWYLASELSGLSGDCDDTDALLNPATVWYKDVDTDLYSDGVTLTQCAQPVDHYLSGSLTGISGDCDDTDSVLNPDTLRYLDADGDGYSDGSVVQQCARPVDHYLATELTST